MAFGLAGAGCVHGQRGAAQDTCDKVLQHEITIPPPPRLGNDVVIAKGLRKGFGDKVLFENGAPIRIEGEELLMIREAEVVGIYGNQQEERVKKMSDRKATDVCSDHVEADAA